MAHNVYGPHEVRALQKAFDRVWHLIGPSYKMSKDDVAQLIIALAADGGANDSCEIDEDGIVKEALHSIEEIMHDIERQNAWSTYPRARAARYGRSRRRHFSLA